MRRGENKRLNQRVADGLGSLLRQGSWESMNSSRRAAEAAEVQRLMLVA